MSLPHTMKALVAYGQGDYRYEPDYTAPSCGPDDIIIFNCASGKFGDFKVAVTF